MSESTKYYRWLPWAVVLSIVLAFFVADIYLRTYWHDILPGQNAHRVTTIIAIDAFDTGVAEQKPYRAERGKALAGILILFIIGPSLWIFSEVRYHSNQQSEKRLKGADWCLGTAIVALTLLLIIPQAVQRGILLDNIKEGADRNRQTDEIRANLATLGFKAAQLYYLPQEQGGGSGSFKTIAAVNEEKPRPLRLADLSGRFGESGITYLIGPVESDSVLTIVGVGQKKGKNPDFKNANGEQGKVQQVVRVLPESKIFEYDRSRIN